MIERSDLDRGARLAKIQHPHGRWGWVAIGRARSARVELTRAIEDTPGGLVIEGVTIGAGAGGCRSHLPGRPLDRDRLDRLDAEQKIPRSARDWKSGWPERGGLQLLGVTIAVRARERLQLTPHRRASPMTSAGRELASARPPAPAPGSSAAKAAVVTTPSTPRRKNT